MFLASAASQIPRRLSENFQRSDFERFCKHFLEKRSVKKRRLFEALAEFWRFSEANLEMIKNDQPERNRSSPTAS